MKLHWGNALVIFFAIFLSLAVFFIIFSLRQNNDLADENYYEKGAAYSQQIEINKRSEIYADSIQLNQNNSAVTITLSNYLTKHSQEINIHFYRPSNQANDLLLSIPSQTNNLIDKAKLVNGRYIVKFTWEMNNKAYGLEKVFFVD